MNLQLVFIAQISIIYCMKETTLDLANMYFRILTGKNPRFNLPERKLLWKRNGNSIDEIDSVWNVPNELLYHKL